MLYDLALLTGPGPYSPAPACLIQFSGWWLMNILAFKNIAEIAAWQILQKLTIHHHLKHIYISVSFLVSPLPAMLGRWVLRLCRWSWWQCWVCLQANGGIERAVLDAYCWMYSSWNIPQEYKGACTGGDQVMGTCGWEGAGEDHWSLIPFYLQDVLQRMYHQPLKQILYYTFCAFFVKIKRQRFAFAQTRRWQYTKLLLSLLFT